MTDLLNSSSMNGHVDVQMKTAKTVKSVYANMNNLTKTKKLLSLKKNPFKPGDKVKYKDGDPIIYYVYAVYSPTKLSLGLADYPDTEQDYQTDIKDIKKA